MNGLRHLAYRGNDVIVLHVLDPSELHFDFDQSAQFVDMETRAEMHVIPGVHPAGVPADRARPGRLFREGVPEGQDVSVFRAFVFRVFVFRHDEFKMNDHQLLRYSRHILLNEIGIEGQQRLLDAKVLIIGMGGLGSPAALYLAASGVGRLTLCDHDTVDFSNLQRQIIHRTSTVNQPKVASAQTALHDINPEVECIALDVRADAAQLHELVANADVVLDCSDNFATRYAVNRACLVGANRWCRARRYSSTGKSPCSIFAATIRPATTACSRRTVWLQSCAVRPPVYSRR